jgi:hypothetical protein
LKGWYRTGWPDAANMKMSGKSSGSAGFQLPDYKLPDCQSFVFLHAFVVDLGLRVTLRTI